MNEGTIYIISDGTGETASTMIRAALVQYSEAEIHLVRCKNIRTEQQVEPLIDEAFEKRGLIVYTVVSVQLRNKIRELASAKGIPSIDLLGPLLGTLDKYFGVATNSQQAGLLRTVDEQYFKRIEAIEYTVKHDDGKTLAELDKADIILVGISRTSKTPLSIFLSHKGWKVANVPLVIETPLPKKLFEVDQRMDVVLAPPGEEFGVVGLARKIDAGAVGEMRLRGAVHRMVARVDPRHRRDRAEFSDRGVGDLRIVHDVGIVVHRDFEQDSPRADFSIGAEFAFAH